MIQSKESSLEGKGILAKCPEISVSQIPKHGIPLLKHSFVGQGLDETLEIKVALGHEILVD